MNLRCCINKINVKKACVGLVQQKKKQKSETKRHSWCGPVPLKFSIVHVNTLLVGSWYSEGSKLWDFSHLENEGIEWGNVKTGGVEKPYKFRHRFR